MELQPRNTVTADRNHTENSVKKIQLVMERGFFPKQALKVSYVSLPFVTSTVYSLS
jgi:hypothetical protein